MRLPSWRHFERKRNWFAALGSEVFATCKPARVPGTVTPPSAWTSVLILGDHHLGDLLYRSCSFLPLRQWLPQANFSIMTTPATASLVQGTDGWTPLPGYQHERRDTIAIEALPPRHFDAAICTSSWRIHEDLKLAIQLRIPNRAALAHKGFSSWITHPLVPPKAPMPYAMEIWDLFRQASGQLPMQVPQTLSPRVFHTAPPRRDKPRIAIFTTSRQPVEQWPESSFATTANELASRGWEVVLMGSRSDQARLERIQAQAGGKVRVSAGELDLRGLTEWLASCRLVLATDSGPRHLANAVGVPVCFFRNLRSDPVGTGVYSPHERDLVPPDIQSFSRSKQAEILANIQPHAVCQALLELDSSLYKPTANG